MKDLAAIKGRHYIHSLIEEGEHEQQDFKFAISDARKIARSISAFSNHSGGRLLIGVKDNGAVAGVRNEEDVYMIETAAEMYCRPAVEVRMTAFKVDPGTVVIRAEIPKALRPPVCVVEAGNELRAYYRVNDENIVAHPLLLSAWAHYADDNGALVAFDSHHRLLIDLIKEEGCTTLDEFVRRSHLSTATATDLIGRLAAASVGNLEYRQGQLVIVI
ncbi:MAG: ATP-binding protein [Muribaculaceae bacterium]|nr:ATP-binding protein [Muribaculaceae bacterium]